MPEDLDPAMRSMIAAIRADGEVGHNSLSVIDECWEDGELAEMLTRREITTPEAAVSECREINHLFREREREVRSFIF